MALTANRELRHTAPGPEISFPVLTATHIYKGALVGLSSGYARGLVAGDVFVGIAEEEINNAGASGAKRIGVYSGGDFYHTLASVAITDVGDPVYASADDTITTSSGASAVLCGAVMNYEAANTALVRFIPTGLIAINN